MADIIALLLPFFGLMLVGYVAAKVTRQPVEALGWLNTFIIYAALPALFFKLVSRTPIEQLTRIDFILGEIAAGFSGVFMRFLTRFRRHLGLVEKIMGAFLIITGLAFIFGFVTEAAIWFQQTFPILMQIG